MRSAILAIGLVICLQTVSAHAETSFREMWDDTVPLLTEGAELIASGKELGERSLSEVLTFRDARFPRILEECFTILAESSLVDLLHKQDAVAAKVARNKAKIVELKTKSVAAPESSWNPLAHTQASIRSDIAELQDEITQLQRGLEEEREAVYRRMQEKGIALSREQFDQLLAIVDAPERASIMAVAENLKRMHQEICAKIAEPDSPVEMLQTYTGVYMMGLGVYLYALETAIAELEGQYMPRLKALREENEVNYQKAKQLAAQDLSPHDAEIVRRNMLSQQRVTDVLNLYERYLNSEARQLRLLHQKTQQSFGVAVNTYHTVKVSTELLSMIRTSEDGFFSLSRFQPPELSLLYDERLAAEFATVTEKLRGQGEL